MRSATDDRVATRRCIADATAERRRRRRDEAVRARKGVGTRIAERRRPGPRSGKRASLVVAQEVDVKPGTASDWPAASSRVTKALDSSSLTYTALLLAAASYREHAGIARCSRPLDLNRRGCRSIVITHRILHRAVAGLWSSARAAEN
jgi:hypothetical protein